MSSDEVLSLSSTPLPAPERRIYNALAAHASRNGGALTVHQRGEDDFFGGYVFGEEEPGSDMAGGAAYGMGRTILEVLQQISKEMGGLLP